MLDNTKGVAGSKREIRTALEEKQKVYTSPKQSVAVSSLPLVLQRIVQLSHSYLQDANSSRTV
jgi:hypothetical protein